jgi:hypothetical protein
MEDALMNGSRIGIALAGVALLMGPGSAAGQEVGISLSWGSSSQRVSGYYVSDGLGIVGHVDDERYESRRPRRLERRHYSQCVPEGPYLYCWDAPRYYRERPVVYVYLTNPGAARRAHPVRGRDWDRGWERRREREHQRLAARYWRRWADDHRYRYDRDRLIVDLAFVW